eukprot:163206-Chlamydomonas_euryale.AAC.2
MYACFCASVRCQVARAHELLVSEVEFLSRGLRAAHERIAELQARSQLLPERSSATTTPTSASVPVVVGTPVTGRLQAAVQAAGRPPPQPQHGNAAEASLAKTKQELLHVRRQLREVMAKNSGLEKACVQPGTLCAVCNLANIWGCCDVYGGYDVLEVAQHPHMPERGEMRQPNPGEAFY